MASSRLTLREDGLVEYRLKRPMPNGCAVLVLTPLDFLRVASVAGGMVNWRALGLPGSSAGRPPHPLREGRLALVP